MWFCISHAHALYRCCDVWHSTWLRAHLAAPCVQDTAQENFVAPVLQVLSSVFVTSDKFLQRCAVRSSTGEQAILTFELIQQECLQSAYKGVQIVQKWVLHSVTGECDICSPPHAPDPSLSPDAVALAQLHFLR